MTVLVLALMSVWGGMLITDLNAKHRVDSDALLLCGGYLVLIGLAHTAVRRLVPAADPLILACVTVLNGLGLVMIHRLDLSSAATAADAGKPAPTPEAVKQLAFTAAGLALFAVVLWRVRDHRRLARYRYSAGAAGLILLVLPGVLPSSLSEVNGAKLWLKLGPASIQPGEFAKLLVIVFAAGYLVAKRELFTTAGTRVLGMTVPRIRDLAPLLLAWGVSVGVLALEKELGASLLFFGVLLTMLYVATGRLSWFLIGLGCFTAGAITAYYLFAHVQTRVRIWLDPFQYYDTSGYQLAQGLFGIGTGGITGTGLGLGHPAAVPFADTDFITSSLAEELGLAGLAAILVTYLLLVSRGLRAGLAVTDSFGKLLAAGLSFAMAFQVFVVVGGVTGLIPLTGMTMPFLSAGGSSLLANYLLVALLLRISDRAARPRPTPAQVVTTPPPPLASAHTVLIHPPR
ncbi:FtsW/RodA/SpoVE family cell cycle protein [Amycolatopsis sp. CA-230715]|uniref:FtsW/RodA/SpoVE family cell cycle protein n=1 Tax=Amycolatopsis sp. CA-230715 TaxID=2745196 RepID=UPI001C33C739|nr:FtsW/RodA/SpoVE family cell cycle protein [Amycolatopsis sp. CA-230715]QWF78981.1 putative FtsW-like protein [Amycolatopsis sp. CA-230715]